MQSDTGLGISWRRSEGHCYSGLKRVSGLGVWGDSCQRFHSELQHVYRLSRPEAGSSTCLYGSTTDPSQNRSVTSLRFPYVPVPN